MNWRLLAWLPLFACIVGCSPKQVVSAAGKMGQVVWDPSITVGDPEDQPSLISLSLYATKTVNPNPNSIPPEIEPEPLTVTFTANSEEELHAQMRVALQGYEIEEHLEGEEEAEVVVPSVSAKPSPGTVIEASGLETAQKDPPKQLGEYSSGASSISVTIEGDEEEQPVIQDDAAGRKKTAAKQQTVDEFAHAQAIATPVTLKVLQLKDDSMFLDADFDSLGSDMRKALGSTYIEHDDYVLRPGQFKYLPVLDISKKTRFIAVYAQFHDMENAVWKDVVPVLSRGRVYNLMLSIDGKTVILQQEGVPK